MKLVFYITFFLISFLSFGQEITVIGIITDEKNGEPLPFVKVSINDRFKGTSTDFDGKYSIKTQLNDTLIFTFTGHKTQKIKVEKSEINAQLIEIDEIEIVLPYEPQIKQKSRNKFKISYESIDEKELKKNKTIKGKVTHENGEILASSHIKIKKTKRETFADFEGEFEIEASKNDVLIISFPGYSPKEIKITDENYYEVILTNYEIKMTRKQKRELRKKGFYIFED